MKPRGMLMKEHRLIEKMIQRIEKEVRQIQETGQADPAFIDAAADFIRTYADRTHHGKEEDILFAFLEKKDMDAEHEKQKNNLIEEHKYGRKLVKQLVDANQAYAAGDKKHIDKISEILKALADFYPGHIWKEDKVFFPETESCFSENELDQMLDQFREFDQVMIHEKYQTVIEAWQ